MIYIYKITNTHNGKSYIGQTINTENRWRQHKSGNKSPISKAIARYGLDAFEFEIIATAVTEIEANEIETRYIKEQNVLVPNGYNLAPSAIQARKSKIPDKVQQQIIELYTMNVPVKDISETTGWSIGAIAKTLRRHNIPTRAKLPNKRNRVSKIDQDTLIALLREGKSTGEIAEIFGTNYKYVWKYIKYHNIEEYNTKPTRDRQSNKG